LVISIEGAVVPISAREGATRQYRAGWELPHEIDAGSSEAKLQNGVLNVKLTKKIALNGANQTCIH
jgi:HSP20 family molecular chaperone IbpA